MGQSDGKILELVNESVRIDLVLPRVEGPGAPVDRPYRKEDFKRAKVDRIVVLENVYRDVVNIMRNEKLSLDIKSSE